jgi:hypothetical protein
MFSMQSGGYPPDASTIVFNVSGALRMGGFNMVQENSSSTNVTWTGLHGKDYYKGWIVGRGSSTANLVFKINGATASSAQQLITNATTITAAATAPSMNDTVDIFTFEVYEYATHACVMGRSGNGASIKLWQFTFLAVGSISSIECSAASGTVVVEQAVLMESI